MKKKNTNLMFIERNNILRYFIEFQVILLPLILAIRMFELFYLQHHLIVPEDYLTLQLSGFYYDILFWMSFSVITGLVVLPLLILWKCLAKIVIISTHVLYIVGEIGLIFFHSQRGAPLDSELFSQSVDNTLFAVKSSGLVTFWNISVFIVILTFYVFLLTVKKKLRLNPKLIAVTIFLILVFGVYNIAYRIKGTGVEYKSNKLQFLIESVFFQSTKEDNVSFDGIQKQIHEYQNTMKQQFVSEEFPLLKTSTTNNVLGDYITIKSKAPNIVILIVESLSRDFCGNRARYGNFITPFLDSLTRVGLYWENCLSTAPLSFEALPAILGSLPHGKQGFNMLPEYPNHTSLIKILNANNYFSFFIAGSPLYFDNQGSFMRNQGTKYISYHFPEKYTRMDPESKWSYGYPDDATFDFGLQLLDTIQSQPFVQVYVTITTHPPFKYEKSVEYVQKFEDALKKQSLPQETKADMLKIREQLGSFMYFDDVLRDFFQRFRKRADFENTIFVITGDHQGYYAPKNVLGKYHVPLILYSPLQTKAKVFSSIVSHKDVTPTLVALLQSRENIKIPSLNSFLGNPLDTSSGFNSNQKLPLLGWNKSVQNVVWEKFFQTQGVLYRIVDKDLNISEIQDGKLMAEIDNFKNQFETINNYVCYSNKLIPDSLSYETLHFSKECFRDVRNIELIDNKNVFPLETQFQFYPKTSAMKIEVSFDAMLPAKPIDSLPQFVFAISDEKKTKNVYYDSKNLSFLNNEKIKPGEWMNFSIKDIIRINPGDLPPNPLLSCYLYNPKKYPVSYKSFSVNVYCTD